MKGVDIRISIRNTDICMFRSTRSYASDDYDVWLIKVKGEPAEPTGELTEQSVPIPGFKISGLLLGLILSVALATLKKMKNR